MDNVFYYRNINVIGGLESFFYYLSRLYKNMVVYYETGDPIQVQRLAEKIEVRQWHGEKVKCKRFFGNYGLDNILPYLEAEEKYFVIHCDYKRNKTIKTLTYPGFKYIAVSKLAQESFEEETGEKAEIIYNPVVLEKSNVKKKPGLHLLSATRLSSEKGGWRIDKLIELLDKSGVKYTWDIYTNKPKKINFDSPNVHLHEPKLDLSKEMAEATWVVQLSDHEAFGLTPCESLILGTPVIVTDIPAFHEIGCNENNSIFLDLNMTNVDIDKIKKGLPKFEYTPPKSNWKKYLSGDRDYDPNSLIEVEIKRTYTDVVLKRKLKRDAIEKMTRVRASYLEAKGLVQCCYQ